MPNTYLVHHGILGQKWGIRRYQNEDGSYKSGAEGRYYNYDPKGRRAARKQLRADKRTAYVKAISKANGESEEAIRKELDAERKKILKIAAVGGAVALAGGGYLAYQKLKKDPYSDDFIIPAGESIFRTSSSAGDKLHDSFYATGDKVDKARYIADFGRDQGMFGTFEYKYKKEYSAKTDLKIASGKTGEQLYKDLLKNNPDFKELIKDSGYRSYKEFNMYAPLGGKFTPFGGQDTAFKVFQEKLKAKGYAGLIDNNDKYGAGLQTNAPVIFFGGNTNFNTKSVSKITKEDIREAERVCAGQKMEATLKLFSPSLIKVGAAAVASSGIKIAAQSAAENKAYEEQENKKKKKEDNNG